MIDQRLRLLKNWLKVIFKHNNFNTNKAHEDASFRRYFRIELKKNNKNISYIAMDAPPEKENSQDFVFINKHLIKANIHVPKIIKTDLTQGFLLLEDLGNNTFLNVQQQKFNIDLYKEAINILLTIQSIKTKNIQPYSKAIINYEMQLFVNYYLPKKTSAKQNNKLSKVFAVLTKNALSTPQLLVHRDYHSRNLMIINNKTIGVLDFQDAAIGCYTYDLVSLLKDVYFELSYTDIKILLNYYYNKTEITTPFTEFENQFNLMGVQRHLKILGIFKRLAVRDGKHQYLQYLPKISKNIIDMAEKYQEISILKKILCAL